MLNELLIWGALLVGFVFLVVDRRRGIGALTLSYFLALSLGHVPGLLAYLDPTFLVDAGEPTKIGFDATLIAIMAFIVGALAARIVPHRTINVKSYQSATSAELFSRLSWRVLTMGIIAYFVLLPVSAFLPSLTAVASAFGSLLILGFWLRLYGTVNARDDRRTFLTLMMLPLLPLATLTTGGFLGYGTVWILSILSFLFVIARRRIWFYLSAPLIAFLGLSLFVTYFYQREEIREVVWDQTTSIVQRLGTISTLVTDFQLLDLSNDEHMIALDERLNQNYLVGAGIMRHRAGKAELLYGETIPYWAVIPRAIWPDKPAVGGGRDLVEQFTGIGFEEGTSVGAGQVLEFYINFGMPGVVAGFAVFGFMLMRIDQGVMRAFATRNIHGVILAGLPGLALLQPLGNLLEIIVAVASTIISSRLLVHSKLIISQPTRGSKTKTSGQTTRAIARR